MSPDWKALTPHIPLETGAAAYVTPPSGGASELANWIRAGGSTVLLGGPAGIGKSTELARTARLLQEERFPLLVQLDRFENMRELDADRLLLRIAGRAATLAQDMFFPSDLWAALYEAGVVPQTAFGPKPPLLRASPAMMARQTLLHIARTSRQGRVTLLLDGLEKTPPGASSFGLFEALGSLPKDVELVVVIPWHAAFGPSAEVVVRPSERLQVLRAPDVEGDAGEAGREFLAQIFSQRVGETRPSSMDRLLAQAAVFSGGLPRTFLQLMADAGTYARIRREAEWPEEIDLEAAVADRQDSFRRLLLPGDVKAMERVLGTDGLELRLERKIRLLAHGVLLERIRQGRPILELHPLAREAMKGPHA